MYNMNMKKILIILAVLVLIILGLGIYKFNFTNNDIYVENGEQINSHDGTYIIDGQKIILMNGISEIEAAPGSASKIVTKYFGNDLKHDINDDSIVDDIFIVTQETGGSGVFYYVVALVSTSNGLAGSDGILLGDRITPQTINIDEGKTTNGTIRKNVIVVNYVDRAHGESFDIAPSVGKSIWLKLDPKTMQFGEVAQNFEGEAINTLSEVEARIIAERSCIKGGEVSSSGTYNKNSKTWWYDANLNATRPGCNPACVVSENTKTAEINWRCTGLKEPVACTMDAKQCPDGSYVGRSGPNCEFVCPQ